MKKAFITLMAILIASVSMAAGHVDSVRYLTTKFGRNWFLSAEGNIDWWKGSLVTPANYQKDYTGFNDMSFGGAINFGKWINHNVGVRLSYDVNGANSYIYGRHSALEGIQFLYTSETPVEGEVYATSFVFHNLHGDVMFSPIDFFQGYYNPNRVYTPVVYVGMGAASVCDEVFLTKHFIDKMLDTAQKDGANLEMSFNAGLINNFRLNDYLDLHLDLKYVLTRWNIDSWRYEFEGLYFPDGTQGYSDANQHALPNANGEYPESIRPKRIDQNFSVGFGLTYYIGGRVYDLPYNYEKEMKEMTDRIKNLENELANQPEVAPVQQIAPDTIVKFIHDGSIEAISYPFSIFFNLDSYELMSRRDVVNMTEIAKVAKENNYKLRLRGSADSATATSSYNQTLSENRCQTIKLELLKLGVPESNIIVEPVGGVKELDPTELDRRVLIDIIKEAK